MTGRSSYSPYGGLHNWMFYIMYFIIALLIAWGAVFFMLRAELIPRGTWLYEHTTWIPGMGIGSWVRQPR